MDQAAQSKPELILEQWAHMDWDWVGTFAQNYWYYKQRFCDGADSIIATNIEKALRNLDHHYTICEMAFLRRYVETHPGQIERLVKHPSSLGDRFEVVGGGFVSPDCLVCSGEGFIRNFLVGQTWLYETLGMKAKPHCWLPDDFGQGPELPVLLKALGFTSVAFARIPSMDTNSKSSDLSTQLYEEGIDFKWQAGDQSSVVAHWMGKLYNTGPDFENRGKTSVREFLDLCYSQAIQDKTATVMYMPIANDFMMPSENLDRVVTEWNQDAERDVTIRKGTYSQFVSALEPRFSSLKIRTYNGTPYWTGHYANRPELKILHNETVRTLVGAEIVALLAQIAATTKPMLPADFWTRVKQTWTDFVPSTHHDYICATAPDAVYTGEQLPLLRGAAAAAQMLRATALSALSSMTATPGTPCVIVANPLGFERTGFAIIDGISLLDQYSGPISWSDQSHTQMQQTAEGGTLVYAKVRSFGYTTGAIGQSPGEPTDTEGVVLTPLASNSNRYTLENEYLSATITEQAQWGIARLFDKQGESDVFEVGGGPGNAILFYDDSAGNDLYRFSNEFSATDRQMPPIADVKTTTSGAGLGVVVLEEGPLRARLRTEVLYEFQGPGTGSKVVKSRFIREYELRKGEPFLRLTTTGMAPPQTSVMVRFPLTNGVSTITHGTGYHWTDVQPSPCYWDPPVFRATHDFVLPCDKHNRILGAVYHEAVPAWAIDRKDNLIGCLLRNAGSVDRNYGAAGSDSAPHTQRYAIRVPTGLGDATTGQPLREAQSFHTPLLAAQLTDSSNYPDLGVAKTASIAEPTAESGSILTVAKPGSYDAKQLVLRLYQATNAPLVAEVKVHSNPSGASMVTATEQDMEGQEDPKISQNVVTVSMENSIATVSIGGLL